MECQEIEIACTDAQRDVITAETKPNGLINVISGPGTGKTKTLCDRIAYLLSTGMRPNEIVVFSLTNQAVNDFKRVLSATIGSALANAVEISTIHSYANSIVLLDSPYWQIIRDKRCLDRTILNTVLRSLPKRNKQEYQKFFHDDQKRQPCTLKPLSSGELHRLKLDDPNRYKAYLGYNFSDKVNILNTDSFLYDKIVFEATQILRLHNELGLEGNMGINVPLGVLEAKEVFVDEFQDTSYILLDFILELAKNKQLTIAGDIDQSLYGFNGATPDYNIKKVISIYKQKGYSLKEVVLDQTFRFGDDIHKLSLNLLGTPNSLISKTLEENHVPVVRQEFANSMEEYEFIYNEIHALIEKSNYALSPKNFAVLSLTNQTLNDFQTYFDNKKSPYFLKRITGQQAWLDTKMSSLVSLMKVMENPNNDPCFMVAVSFMHKIGPVTTLKLKTESEKNNLSIYEYIKTGGVIDKKLNPQFIKELDEILEKTDKSDPSSIIVGLIDICTLFNFSSQLDSSAMDSFKTIVQELYKNFKILSTIEGGDTNLLSQFLSTYQAEFFKEVDVTNKHSDYLDEFITLSTIHSAKGLQWDVVFIVSTLSLLNGSNKNINARTCYVGATRARHLLYYNKSIHDNELYIDTTSSKDVEKSVFSLLHQKTMSNYIPELKKSCVFNDLKKLPKFGKPYSKNQQQLSYAIDNIKLRACTSTVLPVLTKSITKLCKNI